MAPFQLDFGKLKVLGLRNTTAIQKHEEIGLVMDADKQPPAKKETNLKASSQKPTGVHMRLKKNNRIVFDTCLQDNVESSSHSLGYMSVCLACLYDMFSWLAGCT